MNLSTMVNNHAQRVPNWDAVVSENQILSWKEFNDSINKLGNALRRLGIKKGDRVAIYLPNSPEYIVSYFAVVRIGAIVVPLNLMYRSSELNYIINNCRPFVDCTQYPKNEKYMAIGRTKKNPVLIISMQAVVTH
jgi:long-chain acyl-CoA synthetase